MSFQNIPTPALSAVIEMFDAVKSSDDFEQTLGRCKAELDKRNRLTEGGQVKDEKWSRLDEMPYGKYEGCKFSGIPVQYLKDEVKRLESLSALTDEEKQVLGTCKHTIEWKANKEPISKMPFGKHKNQAFDDIPVGYLEWLSNNAKQPGGRPLDEDLQSAIDASIERRSK